MSENLLKTPPPEDADKRIMALAYDLAFGAKNGLWSSVIDVIMKRDWRSGQTFQLDDYLQEKWNNSQPSAESLEAKGYLFAEDKSLLDVVRYRITDKAFDLLDQPGLPDARDIFVVHGRNLEIRDILFEFLKSIGLHPIEWEEAVSITGEGSPLTWHVLEKGFSSPRAVIVLMTPDDEARLRKTFWQDADDRYEREFTPQARPNVLFEAGMALTKYPDRTIIVEIGRLRPFSDLLGRQTIRLGNTSRPWKALAKRLKTLKCPVDSDSLDHLDWRVIADCTVDDLAQEVNSTQWDQPYHAFWLPYDLHMAFDLMSNQAVEEACEKLQNAYDHALNLGLKESEAGKSLKTLRDEAESTPLQEWTPLYLCTF